jgi:hypothetical protein
MFSYCIGWLGLLLLGAPLDELKLVKPLPVMAFSWPIPSEVLRIDNAELAEITRITGSIGVFAEAPKAQVDVALQIAAKHNARLCPMFRPWFEPTVADPTLPAAQAEFSVTWQQWYTGPAKAISASVYKPQVVCLVDTESFDCREEPKRSKCAELYSSYDAFIRRISGCTEVYWYGFGEVAAPAEPNGYAFQPWAVSFSGMKSVGWESYGVDEIAESRVMSHKARAYGDSLGIPISVWTSVGCGQRYDWNPFKSWTWAADQSYSREMGAELFGKWWRERPQRFHAPSAAVIFYPSLIDLRIVDPEWKNRLAFLKGATE